MPTPQPNSFTFDELEKGYLFIDEDGSKFEGKEITNNILELARLEIELAKQDFPETYQNDRLYKVWSSIKENREIGHLYLETTFQDCEMIEKTL